ncbi:cardiolipin synthase [Proteinivorax hydrogeniformans]|uniref:Cardiolipin synthase n=1 Tax=Proteinivorax hydrogeniformans TaxID=1826727 RepID=A0AAU8HUU6_9FIRM
MGWLWMTLFLAIVFIISIIVLLQNRDPSRTLAWILVLFFLPGLGILLYLYLGQTHRKKKTFLKKRKSDYKAVKQLLRGNIPLTKHNEYVKSLSNDSIAKKMIPLFVNSSHAPLTTENDAEILQNGSAAFSEMLRCIKEAKSHVHVEFFIIKESDIGEEFRQALIDKAKEGIPVRLVYDAVGSWKLKKSFLKPLEDAGVDVRAFLPVSLPFLGEKLNYRNHRKILVVDGKIGFLGGLNIGDEYLGKDPKRGFWRDTHLKVAGASVYVLQTIFLRDWQFVSKQDIEVNSVKYYPPIEKKGNVSMQIVSSGPDSYWTGIQQGYFASIANAKEKVYITTPYLIPDESILVALKTAALAGIDVRILVPSIPDHKTVFWASKSHFQDLLDAGVRIYQYEKGFVHGKVIIVDDNFTSIGSANLDVRSFELSFEVNGFIYDKKICAQATKDFLEDLGNSKEVILKEYLKRPITDKIKESLARLLSPLL